MAVEHDRCRFWPRCRVHMGWPRPHRFSAENKAEMREMRDQDISVVEIARIFNADRRYLNELLGRKEYR